MPTITLLKVFGFFLEFAGAEGGVICISNLVIGAAGELSPLL